MGQFLSYFFSEDYWFILKPGSNCMLYILCERRLRYDFGTGACDELPRPYFPKIKVLLQSPQHLCPSKVYSLHKNSANCKMALSKNDFQDQIFILCEHSNKNKNYQGEWKALRGLLCLFCFLQPANSGSGKGAHQILLSGFFLPRGGGDPSNAAKEKWQKIQSGKMEKKLALF